MYLDVEVKVHPRLTDFNRVGIGNLYLKKQKKITCHPFMPSTAHTVNLKDYFSSIHVFGSTLILS